MVRLKGIIILIYVVCECISIPYGAIKSWRHPPGLCISRKFQFLMVRLKDSFVSEPATEKEISIPYGAIKRLSSFTFIS